MLLRSQVVGEDLANTSPVPEDTCILELDIPAGASFRINNQGYPARLTRGVRRLPFHPFTRGQIARYELSIALADGQTTKRSLLLRGGETVRLSVPSSTRRPELVLQVGHSILVNAGTFSPDSRRLLTGAADGTVKLWDVERGLVLRSYEGYRGAVGSLAFTPNGQSVLASGFLHSTLWESETGREIRTFIGAVPYRETAPFSPDGNQLFTTDYGIATLWDVKTGKRLHTLKGHTNWITMTSFGRDGRHVLTFSTHDGMAKLWDTKTGREVRTFTEGDGRIVSIKLSPDSRYAVAVVGRIADGNNKELVDRSAKLFETVSGRALHTFQGHESDVADVVFSPDGKMVLTGSSDKTAKLWDTLTGQEIRSFKGHTAEITEVFFDPTGSHVLTVSLDDSAKLWETKSGLEQRSFRIHGGAAVLSFSQNGTRLFYTNGVSLLSTGAVWDVDTGQEILNINSVTRRVTSASFSSDGRRILTLTQGHGPLTQRFGVPKVWGAEPGREIQTFKGNDVRKGYCLSLSPNFGRILTADDDGNATIWDVDSGRHIHVLKGHSDAISSGRFSPDGKMVLTCSRDKTAKLWNAGTGTELRTFKGDLHSLEFSSDGRRCLTASSDALTLWDVRLGRELLLMKEASTSASLSPDGRRLLIVDAGDVRLRDVETGRTTQMPDVPATGSVRSSSFSPDGKIALIVTGDSVYLWELKTGDVIQPFKGVHSLSSFASLSPDGKLILTSSRDGTTCIWSVATGEELARLVNLEGDEWLIMTPQGLFDGSSTGREHVTYRIGDGLNVVPVDRFFNDFYTPGLLGRLLNGERPMPDVELGVELPPKLLIVSPQSGQAVSERDVSIEVSAEDLGGGIRGPWLMHNGARMLSARETRRDGKMLYRSFLVRLVEGENRIEVGASTNNEFATIDSEPAVLTLNYSQPLEKPELYVLAAGCNGYEDASLRLRFARQDAEELAGLFRDRGRALYEQVHVSLLLDKQVTSDGIREALTNFAETARPQDTLLVFLAGHGTTVGQRYFYIPQSFSRQSGSLDTDVKQQSVAADVLGDWMATVPCLKRMLILDTCASGGAVPLVKTSRSPFALRGVIERLNRNQGVFTIAASAATSEAQEVEELGHGVLTYTLLAGLGAVDTGPLEGKLLETNNANRVASVMEWFGYADSQVPRLMKKYFGQAQDIQFGGSGTSFPVLPLDR